MSRASAVNAASSVISDIEYSTIPYVPAVGNEVIKHATDERKYKAFTLAKNGLRVLVISDPTASRSACAIDVHVGAFSDPPEVPGIAHFCEHMTFLGTKKYPKEDAFSAFLTQNGGSSNAYTDSEDTVYYFDVNSDHLKEGLDRFSGFFEAPLFTPNATARELNAIESEHSKNINDDGFRLI
jgi:insulysin